jgi:hypothetical protein
VWQPAPASCVETRRTHSLQPPIRRCGCVQKLAFYMPAICLYTMLLTVYYVPYTTVIMELSDDPAERDTATTWRMWVPSLASARHRCTA